MDIIGRGNELTLVLEGVRGSITVHILYSLRICWQQYLRLLGEQQTNEQKTVK